MESKKTSTPPTLPAKTDGTRVRIEIETDLLTNQVRMASHSPTVVLMSVLRKAQSAKPKEIPERAVGADRRIMIDYDLAWPEDRLPEVESDASSVLYVGILELAISMVTQNQVLQRIQAAAAKQKGKN